MVLVNNAVEAVEIDIIDELDKAGEVPKRLSERFQAHRVGLTSKARIRVEHAGREWMTENGKKRYLIQKKNQALKVYRTNDVDSLAFPSEFIALPLKRELVSALDNVKIVNLMSSEVRGVPNESEVVPPLWPLGPPILGESGQNG